MPEIITKYPDTVLKIFKDANIKCGMGQEAKILTTCPKDRLCSLPTGEICIYGVKDISRMTQINHFDIYHSSNLILPTIALIIIMIYLLGMLAGIKVRKK